VFYNYQNKTLKKKREKERVKFVSVEFAIMPKLIAFECNQLNFDRLEHGDISVS
jgi:hypothetical protein